jgi:predicted RNA-binding Zn ribbon-like protein
VNANAAPFPFRSGVTSVDLTATFAWHGRKQGLDRIDTVAALARWIEESGLPVPHGDVTEPDAVEIRRLRDAVYDVAAVSAFGRTANQESLDIINEFASRPVTRAQLHFDGAGFGSQTTADFDDLIGTLARDTITLLTGQYANKIKECELAQCWVLFVDRSPTNSRRWCSVHCGQKVTAKNYRARRKSVAAVTD